METETTYKYQDLSDSAKETARQWYLEGMDYEWWEGVYEMVIEDGKEKGFYIDKIFFSGFHSQGDGASWTGQVDVRQWLEENCADSIGVSAWCQLIQEDIISKHIQVTQSGQYCHENTMRFGEIVDDTNNFEDDYTMQKDSIFKGMTIATLFDIIEADDTCSYKSTEQIEQAVAESCKDYARNIYHKLREEYEYLCSEEMMIDHFDCNDYQFTEEGRLANA